MASDSQRLLAQGAPITLADGRKVNVRFGMRELVAIEQHFGSIVEMARQVNNPAGKKYDALVHALACGLMAEGLDHEQLLDLLKPSEMQAYDDALTEAWDEAFPDAEEPDDPNPKGEQNSPGSDGSETPHSPSAAAMISSGA